MTHQETEGVLSPWVRDLRLKRVAALIPPGSTVLDFACGDGFLRQHLPPGCTYLGIDRVAPTTVTPFHRFLSLDLQSEGATEQIAEWLDEPPGIITSIAFLEHISDPGAFLTDFRSLLDRQGRWLGTTPHPRGRRLHDSLSRLYLCSRSGAQEHEDFLDRSDLERIAIASGGTLSRHETFLFGLNQLFEIFYG
ncbi:MAG: class I SAM-dependent methyltransferase [Thermoanaerobaculia bacterium]|nr:class I SAM-dependent methyltransferase [Thermoanaerobaculia bacterium]